jgi:hypothetical protein
MLEIKNIFTKKQFTSFRHFFCFDTNPKVAPKSCKMTEFGPAAEGKVIEMMISTFW